MKRLPHMRRFRKDGLLVRANRYEAYDRTHFTWWDGEDLIEMDTVTHAEGDKMCQGLLDEGWKEDA